MGYIQPVLLFITLTPCKLTSDVFTEANSQFEATSSPLLRSIWGQMSRGKPRPRSSRRKIQIQGICILLICLPASCSDFTFCTDSKYFHRRGNGLIQPSPSSNFKDLISIVILNLILVWKGFDCLLCPLDTLHLTSHVCPTHPGKSHKPDKFA